MSAQTTSKVTGKIIGCVQHDCEQCKARDTEVATAHRQAKTAMDDYQQVVKSYAIELSNRNAEVAELRATNLRLIRGDFNQICSHCAWEAAAPATWEQLQVHIQECPSHPIATLKREIEELQTKLTESNAKLLNVLQGHNVSGIAGQVIIDLQAKLTEGERLNADLLCRLHAAGVIDNAIKEIEGATK